MFKLPPDFERSDFVGKYLAEIGVGIGTVSLNFRKLGLSGLDAISCVTMHGDFSCCIEGVEHWGRASDPGTATELTIFLNLDVTDFMADDCFAFRIRFGQAGEIRVPQDSEEFESFEILIPGKAEINGP